MIRAQPNAIYLVEIELAGLGKYLGTCSLGTNPHYEDSKFTRLIEVYIYHSFEKTFYGTEASLKLLALTRFEGKF